MVCFPVTIARSNLTSIPPKIVFGINNWTYKSTFSITGSIDGTQTNYPISITIPYNASYMRSDFKDIRFSLDGETFLDYTIESKTDSSTATFLVKVPSIPVSPESLNINVFSGNPVATDEEAPDLIYLFDGKIESGILDTSLWTLSGSPTIVTTDSKPTLKLTPGNGVSTKTSIQGNFIVKYGLKFASKGAYGYRFGLGYKSGYAFQIAYGGSGWYKNWLYDQSGTEIASNSYDWDTTTWRDLYVVGTSTIHKAMTSNGEISGTSANNIDGVINFGVWDDGNDVRLSYVKVLRSTPNPPTIGSLSAWEPVIS